MALHRSRRQMEYERLTKRRQIRMLVGEPIRNVIQRCVNIEAQHLVSRLTARKANDTRIPGINIKHNDDLKSRVTGRCLSVRPRVCASMASAVELEPPSW